MNIAYIMRGVSGTGKTTLAQHLAGRWGAIHSTDRYFYHNGQYCFDGSRLTEYHEKNLEAFRASLQNGVRIVICDNTNAQRWEWEPYAEAAKAAGYLVAFVVMPHPDPALAALTNRHGVCEESIRRTIEKWEP